jgi:hypothetical protein
MVALAMDRSWLFVPLVNAAMPAKAREVPADILILDCDEAVPFGRAGEAGRCPPEGRGLLNGEVLSEYGHNGKL